MTKSFMSGCLAVVIICKYAFLPTWAVAFFALVAFVSFLIFGVQLYDYLERKFTKPKLKP